MLCCPLNIEIIFFWLKFGGGKNGIYLLLCPASPEKNPGTGLSDLISSNIWREERNMITCCLVSWVELGVSKILLLYHDFHFWVTLSSKNHSSIRTLLTNYWTWLPHLDLWASVPAPPRLHLMLLHFPSDLLCFIKPDSIMCPDNYCSLNQYYKTVKFSTTLLFPAALPQCMALLFPSREAWTLNRRKKKWGFTGMGCFGKNLWPLP